MEHQKVLKLQERKIYIYAWLDKAVVTLHQSYIYTKRMYVTLSFAFLDVKKSLCNTNFSSTLHKSQKSKANYNTGHKPVSNS